VLVAWFMNQTMLLETFCPALVQRASLPLLPKFTPACSSESRLLVSRATGEVHENIQSPLKTAGGNACLRCEQILAATFWPGMT